MVSDVTSQPLESALGERCATGTSEDYAFAHEGNPSLYRGKKL